MAKKNEATVTIGADIGKNDTPRFHFNWWATFVLHTGYCVEHSDQYQKLYYEDTQFLTHVYPW